MINHKKLLSYSLSSILACTLFSGVGFASHKKKAAAASTTAATSTQAATTTQTAATTSKSKRAAKKLAAESKPAETAPAAAPAAKSEPVKTMTHKTPVATTSTASASDIASAKSKGMVWVNTESKVYHSDGKYYGNTKHGQFMSAADAQKAGYKAAKR